MAHVIITLPESLWLAIKMGVKTFECRKAFPRIPILTGRVYVIIKGTSQVAGYFTIGSVIYSDDFVYLWKTYGRKLFIEPEWFSDYAYSARKYLYLWEIDQVYSFDGVIDREEYFGVKRNPQSIVYTSREPYIPGSLVRYRHYESGRMKKFRQPVRPMYEAADVHQHDYRKDAKKPQSER